MELVLLHSAHQYITGNAVNVKIIVVENGICDSNCISLCGNALWEGMNLSFFSAQRLVNCEVEWDFFSFRMATNLAEGKLYSAQCRPCVISTSGGGVE